LSGKGRRIPYQKYRFMVDLGSPDFNQGVQERKLTLNLLAPTTVGARINPLVTNVIYV
jgi:hypothetical protein